MEAQTTTTEKTNVTNDLRHTIKAKDSEGNDLTIKIRLNDECKNGHNDFSITGDIYQKDKPRIDRYHLSGGCIHEEILKARPDLQIFANLHLCDAKGAPMYAIGNGYYHLRQMEFDTLKDSYRISDEQLNVLKQAEDELHFSYLVHSLALPVQWQNEANEAVKILEQLTGKIFNDDSVKEQYTPITNENIELIEQRLKDGYYTAEKLQERKAAKEQSQKDKQLADLAKDRDSKIKKVSDEYNVKIAVINAGLPLDNFIYYTHCNEGAFNWNTSPYNKEVTQEQFDVFLNAIDYSTLPDGIKFKLK